jgi:two-component system, OmpR family, phosphate regulon sensor histidine kinase PhoR
MTLRTPTTYSPSAGSATSSSAEAGRSVAPLLIRLSVLYAAVFGAAALALAVALDEGRLTAVLALAAAAAAVAAMTAALLVPRLLRLRRLSDMAESLAAGRFEGHVEVPDDEFGPLAAALNAAAANLGSAIDTLRNEHEQLESLLNTTNDATIAVDEDGVVVYLNDGARSMFGPGAEAGRPFIEIVRDHDLNELLVAAARRGERSVRVVAYGPAQRWLQATAAPIDDPTPWVALAVFHDLTEVRRLEGMRRDFMSNVSHELRTPLAGIRAAAETLQEGALDDPPAAQEFLGHIQRETDRLTQMVEELLELSRIESGAAPMKFTRVDLTALVDDTVRRFARQAERAQLTLTARSGESPLTIVGDGERLERALGNLVANAIKFTPAGGSVTVAAAAEGDDVILTVEDTGVGIEPEQQARVFERFYKTDRGRGNDGTGLGLAIVKHIARAHEGSVSVESRPGRGSIFTMRLPRR